MSGGISGMMDVSMDKILEDSVPCRVRAKRGCATHPRSIAERVYFDALQSLCWFFGVFVLLFKFIFSNLFFLF